MYITNIGKIKTTTNLMKGYGYVAITSKEYFLDNLFMSQGALNFLNPALR